MHAVGLVLHPRRDSGDAVSAILGWAARREIEVPGVEAEIGRLDCTAVAVPAADLGGPRPAGEPRRGPDHAAGDAGGRPPAGLCARGGPRQLGFLAEVDVPNLPDALSAIDEKKFVIEQRLAVDALIGDTVATAFDDAAVVGFPGQPTAQVESGGRAPVRSYAATPWSSPPPPGPPPQQLGRGPIVSPAVEALLVTPAAPHSAYNRGLVVSVHDSL